MGNPPLAAALLDALDEPALLVAGERTIAANGAAASLLGRELVGQDIRFAIRQPQALGAILAGKEGKVEVGGIGGVERSWTVAIRRVGPGHLLIRLLDRSAERAAARARTDFVANASHELRTPLAAVLGYAETLAEPAPLDEEVRRRFGAQIHAQALRMMGIVRDLMSLSRIESDRFLAPRDPVELAAVVRDAIDSAGEHARERGCAIDAELAGHLPAIQGDAAQLRQLIDNLLMNALRYGCRTSGDRVLVTLERDGRWQRLRVRDHGEGIAAPHIPRLTERFYRVDEARSRDGGGTGLGLAIVKQVVERHRGELEISSWPGDGTLVEVRFPQA